MSDIERLQQIRLEIGELVETLTEQKGSKEEKNSTEIKKLSSTIEKFINNNNQQFTASYNVYNLKIILGLLLEIIKDQSERIRELETS